MNQAPMLSSPLKQTNEIDWILPLKGYIRQTYGDDPERYAEECATLNRLRQDMRGAGKDSAAGRDLLYRYYGQLELLDLRFPVDENHIKISFTWFDAFTHKSTSQFSLAYEKASIIFNISAVLSCHAAHQNRSDDSGLKTAYHSFQASAGMFTYINENFLHAPSTDLSRDTVKTLIAIMLAQAQEVFLEKQVADQKKVGLLAKLASQAGHLYSQAIEGVQENVNKAIFEKVWLLVVQIKANYLSSVAQYYQALADNDANSYGSAIARLQVAETQAKDANRIANAFPQSVPINSNLGSEAGSNLSEMTRRHLTRVQERLAELIKDNDFIYHHSIPGEASLPAISKLPAAKAIPVGELYQGQDIQRIIGPDIFQKIVPMSVTESASLYDEEKAKLIRAETERVETADGEMAASLDYLKLPEGLQMIKGGSEQEALVDEEFRRWCEDLAGHEPFEPAFENLKADKTSILNILDRSSKQLDMEESVCEKMRSKYGPDWTQQPSSRLTATLKGDIRNYYNAIDEASASDNQLWKTFQSCESDFDEMRSAGEIDEADVLFQRALIKVGGARGKSRNGVGSPMTPQEGNLLDEDYGESSVSVADQIAKVEDLLKRLNLIKRERTQILKDLKDKVHNDDISNVLILNKKTISSQENQLFQSELEKFRPHQNRLLQANHKQASLMKELTRAYSELLQDRRVRSEQSKYEALARQRSHVMTKAQSFYSEMKDTVDSLEKNIETFVNNRRSEGAQLLNQIEQNKANGAGDHADRERERLRELMERMNMEQSSVKLPPNGPPALPPSRPSYQGQGKPNAVSSPPISPGFPAYGNQYASMTSSGSPAPQHPQYPQPSQAAPPSYAPSGHLGQAPQRADQYNPNTYFPRDAYPSQVSPPPSQQYFSPPPGQYGYSHPQHHHQRQQSQPPNSHQQQQQTQQQPQPQPQPQSQPQYIPPGYIPPPPPPGPPPTAPNQNYPASNNGPWPSAAGGYAQVPRPGEHKRTQSHGLSQQGDPWAGLNAWK
ncbi:MAG: bck1-like resistance to osmotic shock [Sarea resinae]|nr:MAG: bck1-like resistance to osmotic shock [Sarea resinae]